MNQWIVEVRGDAIDHCKVFQDYEGDLALIYFLQHRQHDRRVSLISVGEMWEEE